MSGELTIGRVAKLSGVPAKTIRYYEEIGLLEAPQRAANGYRVYDARSVDILRFVARARGLGFPIREVQSLIALWLDKSRRSAAVREIARGQIRAIEGKIAELEGMRTTLQHLVERCHGDDRPECPILDELAPGEGSTSGQGARADEH